MGLLAHIAPPYHCVLRQLPESILCWVEVKKRQVEKQVHLTPTVWIGCCDRSPGLFTEVPQPQAKTRCTSTGNIQNAVLSVSSTSSGSLMSGIDILLGISNWGIRSGHVRPAGVPKLKQCSCLVGLHSMKNSAYFPPSLAPWEMRIEGEGGQTQDRLTICFRASWKDFGAGFWNYYDQFAWLQVRISVLSMSLSPPCHLCPFFLLSLSAHYGSLLGTSLASLNGVRIGKLDLLLLLSLLHRKKVVNVILSILEILSKMKAIPQSSSNFNGSFNKP